MNGFEYRGYTYQRESIISKSPGVRPVYAWVIRHNRVIMTDPKDCAADCRKWIDAQ